MNENFKWIAAAVGVVGLSIGAIVYFSQRGAEPVAEPAPVVAPPAEVAEEPPVRHPLPPADTEQALPSLADSDPLVRDAIAGLIGQESAERYLVPEQLVRHVVVTVDNLPNEKVAERLRPVKPAPGQFAVSGPDEAPVLDPANYQRYEPLVRAFAAADNRALVAAYTRYYPLFQEAYESLGHPPQYFNDRLVEVIDHLLETPEVEGPIALARPSVQFEYADPALEARSAGQKLLIRMGRDHARVVKEKLRDLRRELTAQPPPR